MKLFQSRKINGIVVFLLMATHPVLGYSQQAATVAGQSQEMVDLLSIIASLSSVKKQGVTAVTDEAQRLYKKHQRAVYQIRIINLSSGKKSAIGSGFQFTKEGHIATNFHVVS
ncbi:MAG: hypothetical protein JNN05_02585, partial [Candidatus Omnitrophica bacterium]|nr:hypothetical protein [Candidatus Omnitrophota bacterium]